MKMNIAVLFGGKSVEHEVSVISAVQAMGSLDAEKYEILPVYIAKDGAFWHGTALRDMEKYRDIPALLRESVRVEFVARDGKVYLYPADEKTLGRRAPIALLDVALPIVHGTNVEDGALQGYLKTLGLPFAGCDVLASAVCMDKYVAKSALQAEGFPVLPGLRVHSGEGLSTAEIVAQIEKQFAYPVIIKPVNLGSSVGINRADDSDALADALEEAFVFADAVLIEPCVQNLREINCAVLGDAESARASECEEPFMQDAILSYKDKYTGGGDKKTGGSKGMASLKRKIPADISAELRAEIQSVAVGAFRHLDAGGVARIDFLMDGATGEFWINEFNTIPGSLAFYLWEPIGLPYSKVLDEMIALALKRARHQAELTTSFDTNILASAGSFGAKGKKC
ncbi:MAG: D-alanine--D-alanine ligase [Oscillospiraceae bacterium]|jgi:D-alanine-D-alanine ligase|nr:D-alanine--D-alanine ligase [Oscillospiraceae bacterium]